MPDDPEFDERLRSLLAQAGALPEAPPAFRPLAFGEETLGEALSFLKRQHERERARWRELLDAKEHGEAELRERLKSAQEDAERARARSLELEEALLQQLGEGSKVLEDLKAALAEIVENGDKRTAALLRGRQEQSARVEKNQAELEARRLEDERRWRAELEKVQRRFEEARRLWEEEVALRARLEEERRAVEAAALEREMALQKRIHDLEEHAPHPQPLPSGEGSQATREAHESEMKALSVAASQARRALEEAFRDLEAERLRREEAEAKHFQAAVELEHTAEEVRHVEELWKIVPPSLPSPAAGGRNENAATTTVMPEPAVRDWFPPPPAVAARNDDQRGGRMPDVHAFIAAALALAALVWAAMYLWRGLSQ